MATQKIGRGLGVGGGRRFGHPKTEKERRETHRRLHPGTPLPPRRGMGRGRR